MNSLPAERVQKPPPNYFFSVVSFQNAKTDADCCNVAEEDEIL